jgi:hypothetical protein
MSAMSGYGRNMRTLLLLNSLSLEALAIATNNDDRLLSDTSGRHIRGTGMETALPGNEGDIPPPYYNEVYVRKFGDYKNTTSRPRFNQLSPAQRLLMKQRERNKKG